MANLVTLIEPQSAAAEAYQSLRTNLEFASLEQPLRTVLVTSADQQTDKSVALANLAVVMAQAGDRVLVVDGDLRRPLQHEIFGVPNQAGLTSWLSQGGEPVLQKTTIERLQVLPAGPTTSSPVALLSQKRLESALQTLTGLADYILCDAPPVLAVTDAALWASQVDGVLLLLNAGSTKREQAQRACAVLEKVHARILGAVLLNVDKEVAMTGYAG
ncbi:MAG: CpsD/CapB family tyrosine-protein kinase [Caldilineaceae bacterium]|nr:CpsD/CapB family tyrosine-protein kinase [Caldilineaceae bacterium]